MRNHLVALVALLVVSSAPARAAEPQQFLIDAKIVSLLDPARHVAGAGGWLVDGERQRVLASPRLLMLADGKAGLRVGGGESLELRVLGRTRSGWMLETQIQSEVRGASADAPVTYETRRVLRIVNEQVETITVTPARGALPEIVVQLQLRPLHGPPPIAAAERSTAEL